MIRIVGLSATLPNYRDVARFLGVNNDTGQSVPWQLNSLFWHAWRLSPAQIPGCGALFASNADTNVRAASLQPRTPSPPPLPPPHRRPVLL